MESLTKGSNMRSRHLWMVGIDDAMGIYTIPLPKQAVILELSKNIQIPLNSFSTYAMFYIIFHKTQKKKKKRSFKLQKEGIPSIPKKRVVLRDFAFTHTYAALLNKESKGIVSHIDCTNTCFL